MEGLGLIVYSAPIMMEAHIALFERTAVFVARVWAFHVSPWESIGIGFIGSRLQCLQVS